MEKIPPYTLPDFGQITVKHSARRKTIGIKLKSDGTVELSAPEHTPEKRLKEALEKFTPWLQKKLRELNELPEEDKELKFEFRIGGKFYFCGQSYVLEKAENNNSSVIIFRDGHLQTPADDPTLIKNMLEAFYRRHARRLISSRLEYFSNVFGFSCRKININGARSRFGSCNSRKELNFSWHLAMYPIELIDLVILHECAHFEEMNHSPAFYRVLAGYLPDHRERNKELNKWSRKLSAYPK